MVHVTLPHLAGVSIQVFVSGDSQVPPDRGTSRLSDRRVNINS